MVGYTVQLTKARGLFLKYAEAVPVPLPALLTGLLKAV